MEKIELLNVLKRKNIVEYNYSFSDGLSHYFTDKRFIIHYPVDISSVPESVLTIPFVSNIIQLAWVTNSVLIIPSLDKDFYDCLPLLRDAFSKMFPETTFHHNIITKKIEKNIPSKNGKAAMFYSGGVDSLQTLISHCKENVDLISIWGSDIEYDNENGWDILFGSIEKSIKPFGLQLFTVHSSFRDVTNESILYKEFAKQLKDSWWHGLQHGIGLLGHVAPLAYVKGYEHFFIASTHSAHDKDVRCSSNPSTDNCVRFCGCQIIHDGFEYRRQDKIKNIIKFSNKNPSIPIQLHVCWKTQTGDNCGLCEKCARTIYAILIEGGEPSSLGFEHFEKALDVFNRRRCLDYLVKHPHLYHAWFDIAERANEQIFYLKKQVHWKKIKWLTKLDRNNQKTWKISPSPFRLLVRKLKIKSFSIIEKSKYSSYLRSKIKKAGQNVIFLFGTPTHCNIGDAAIARAEIDFLKSLGLYVIEITVNEWKKHKKTVLKYVSNSLVLLHGGGNFGNLWPYEETIREDIITSVKSAHFILMPQTFFVKKDTCEDDLVHLVDIYNKENFSLFAREKYSFCKMSSLFPCSKVFLVPDIVLFEKISEGFNVGAMPKTTDVLLVLRNDREGLLHYDDVFTIKQVLLKKNLVFLRTDMLHNSTKILANERELVIKEKIEQFASSKLIITDRLHAMIFAYLANVPCIVLHNNNYKIEGVYEWLKDKADIFLLENIDYLPNMIEKALSRNDFKPIDSEEFDTLKKEILLQRKNANS